MNDALPLIQDLTDDFICFICKKKSYKPKIMPCCGKIGCENCIENLLKSNSECPNCHEKDCHIFCAPVHAHIIDSMEQYLTIFSQMCSETNICDKHKKQIEYYCMDCKKHLCSDCIYDELFSDDSSHKSHNIVSIKVKLQNDISHLNSLIDSIESNSYSVLQLISKLDKSQNNILLDLHTAFRNMCSSIEDKKSEALKPIENRINQLTELRDESLKLINQLSEAQSSNILSEIPKVLEESQAINLKYKQMENISPDYNVLNDISPQYQYFQIEIPNFPETQQRYSQLTENETRYILSEKQTINGNKWLAKIYPNGNSNGTGRFLSVFFELTRGSKVPGTFFYRVEIVNNVSSKLNIIKEYNSEFQTGVSWGWNEVTPINKILNEKGFLDSKGSLKLIFGIHAETYYQVFKDLQEAAKYEYMKIKKLKRKSEKK